MLWGQFAVLWTKPGITACKASVINLGIIFLGLIILNGLTFDIQVDVILGVLASIQYNPVAPVPPQGFL